MAQKRKKQLDYLLQSSVGPGLHLHFVSQLAQEVAPAVGPVHAPRSQLLGTSYLGYSGCHRGAQLQSGICKIINDVLKTLNVDAGQVST